jgi:hypothetical protein
MSGVNIFFHVYMFSSESTWREPAFVVSRFNCLDPSVLSADQTCERQMFFFEDVSDFLAKFVFLFWNVDLFSQGCLIVLQLLLQ